jgi:hypothetical protein
MRVMVASCAPAASTATVRKTHAHEESALLLKPLRVSEHREAENPVHTIRSHDALFRFVFGHPEQMAELLRSVLPSEVAATIDWGTLQRLDGYFLDAGLSKRHADLLFLAQMDGVPTLLHVIIEHKSGCDRWTPLQLLRYRVRVWDEWLKVHPGARFLPAVLTLVVHHGDAPWSAPRNVRDLVDVSTVAPAVATFLKAQQPDATFLLWDLAAMSEADLEQRRLSIVSDLTLRFLQFLRKRSVAEATETIARWQGALQVLLGHPRGQEVLVALFSWFLAGVPPGDRSLRQVLVQIQDENTRQSMKSMLDYLLERGFQRGQKRGLAKGREEGREEGLEEGLHEGRLRALLDFLRARFGDLPGDLEQRLRAGDADQLSQWTVRAASASSLGEVLEHG